MKRRLPPWAMGLAQAPLGFYFGYISTAIPILLSARGVTVGEISGVSAVAFSPSFWAFSVGPVLDIRFSRRTYAFFFASMAAVCLAISTLLVARLSLFTAVVTTGCVCAVLYGNAIGGWLADVIEERHYDQVGAWSNIANLGAAGIFSALIVVMVRSVSPVCAALVLALILLLPTILLLFIPSTRQATRAVRDAFRSFFRDVRYAGTRPGFGIGLVCLLSPTACFALTNLFSGMGQDFHSSERWVTAINGPLVAAVCSLGCLAGIFFCGRAPRRTIYLSAGFGGAVAALGFIWLPHTVAYYAAGVLLYNFFQGINYTAFGALSFEIVGSGNPLAATQIGLLAAASNVPISYMTAIDGHFHTTHGLRGMLLVDALTSVCVGTFLLVGLHWLAVRKAEARHLAVPAGG